MDVALKSPMSGRSNFRMLMFFAVLLLPLAGMMYVYFDSVVTGGIKRSANGYLEVDLKAMSVFPFDQVGGTINDIPKKWRELNGKKVVVYGEIWSPYSSGSRLGGFQLCYSITKCCFNGPPQVQHFVHATAVKGKDLEYYQGLVKVKGTLHINVTHDAGKVNHVYWMDAESVEPM